MSDPRFQQYVIGRMFLPRIAYMLQFSRYAQRLQANLTWIAAAADQRVSWTTSPGPES